MSKTELQTILGYLNIGLAIAHDTGVSAGHFGNTDFIQLAQVVNSVLLNAIVPAASSSTTTTAAATTTVAATPAVAVAVASPAVGSAAAAN